MASESDEFRAQLSFLSDIETDVFMVCTSDSLVIKNPQMHLDRYLSLSHADQPQTAFPSTIPAIDTLPPEILILILKLSKNVKTLKAAVHSSPLVHQAYLVAREEILTIVTLHELDSRATKIGDYWRLYPYRKNSEYEHPFRFEEPCQFALYKFRDGVSSVTMPGQSLLAIEKEEYFALRRDLTDLRAAIQTIFCQLSANRVPKLQVVHCCALRLLETLRQYWIKDDYDSQTYFQPGYRPDRKQYGLSAGRRQGYHLMVFQRCRIDPEGPVAAILEDVYRAEWRHSSSTGFF